MSKRRSSSLEAADALAIDASERPYAPEGESSIDVSDQVHFVLDSDRYDVILDTLDTPPVPGPKLRSLLRRVPRWRK